MVHSLGSECDLFTKQVDRPSDDAESIGLELLGPIEMVVFLPKLIVLN